MIFKRRISQIIGALSLCLMVASSSVLAACSCSPSVNKDLFTGRWELASSNVESVDSDSLALAKSLGRTAVLELKSDGSGTLDQFGTESAITWKADSNSEGTLKLANEKTATIKLDDGALLLENSSNETLKFQRSN